MRQAPSRQFPLAVLSLALALVLAPRALAADGLLLGGGPTSTPVPLTLTYTVEVSATPTTTPTAPVLPSATITPTASPSSTFGPSPTPTNTFTPAPPGELPQAPGRPDGTFAMLTFTGAAPKTVMRLRWDAAEPGAYVIKGYLLRRRAAGEDWQDRPGPGVLSQMDAEDLVQVGKAYDYEVQAVDFKDRAGTPSDVFHVDLGRLAPALLAPPAPSGVTATSKRNTIALKWDPMGPWLAPLSAYHVFRALSPDALADAEDLTLSSAALEETPTAQAQDVYYQVAVEDQAGRWSPRSLSVSGRATGTLPPVIPHGLSASAKVEKVSLSWEPVRAGTAPVSAFLLQRRSMDAKSWHKPVVLTPTALSYSEGLDGDQGYLYRLAAVDAEGNTGDWCYVSATPTARVLNKAQVVLMPTAYTNAVGHDAGLNLSIIFDFFVGSLYEQYHDPLTGDNKAGVFQPLQIGTLTSDLKVALLDDRGLIPGLATGLYTSALISFGSGNASTVGVSSGGNGLTTMGDAYAVVSKRFWPGEPGAIIHGGILYGKLADYLTSDPTPQDWRATIRHLTPSGDYPMLFTRFVDPKFNATVGQSPHLAFVGLQAPFTVPLGFTRWKTALRAEAMFPLAWSAEFPDNGTGVVPTGNPADELPWMLNIHLDNLPLFGFEFGILEFPGGMQVIAFYHIPDLSWNW